jgi:hypothetical protein
MEVPDSVVVLVGSPVVLVGSPVVLVLADTPVLVGALVLVDELASVAPPVGVVVVDGGPLVEVVAPAVPRLSSPPPPLQAANRSVVHAQTKPVFFPNLIGTSWSTRAAPAVIAGRSRGGRCR